LEAGGTCQRTLSIALEIESGAACAVTIVLVPLAFGIDTSKLLACLVAFYRIFDEGREGAFNAKLVPYKL